MGVSSKLDRKRAARAQELDTHSLPPNPPPAQATSFDAVRRRQGGCPLTIQSPHDRARAARFRFSLSPTSTRPPDLEPRAKVQSQSHQPSCRGDLEVAVGDKVQILR